jgi:triphosphatase
MAETEIKLYAAPGDLAKLQAAVPLLAAVSGKARTRRVVTDYYETPDFALAKSGVALRVRQMGSRHVQGLKSRRPSANGAGALAASRGEWEWPIEGSTLDLRRLNHAAIAELVPVHALSALEPLFRTDIQRTTIEIKPDEATRIELSFDRGRIVADGRSVPICEVELELRSPERPYRIVTLYRLALELQRAAPIALGAESKADRGYRLVTKAAPDAVKSAAIALDHAIRVRAGIRSILRSCTAHIAANQAATLVETETGGVHQMRVGIRQLRSAMRLFKDFIASPETSWIAGELKWLAGELGPARDWDVLTTHTLGLAKKNLASPAVSRQAIDGIAKAAEKRRRAAHAAVHRAIAAPRYTTLLLTLGAWIEEDRWCERLDPAGLRKLDAPLVDTGRRLLGRLDGKVKKAGHNIREASPNERHKLRKKLKKLRYASHFLASLYRRKRVKRHLGRLNDIQDTLGALNDFAVARKLLGELAARHAGPSGAAARLQASLGRLARKQSRDLESGWRRYRKPDPFWA